jgi:hypothetical protein
MSDNTITIRLSDDDRARLDKLTAALEKSAAKNCESYVQSAVQMATTAARVMPAEESQEPAGATEAEPAEKNTPEQNEPVVATEEPQETAEPAEKNTPEQNEPVVATEEPQETAEPTPAEPEPAKPSVTLEQIQQKVVKLAAAGKKAAVKDIITAYGAKVSDLKDQPEKWNEVWGKLNALEG